MVLFSLGTRLYWEAALRYSMALRVVRKGDVVYQCTPGTWKLRFEEAKNKLS